MNRKNLQDLIKNLQEFYQCPSCSTHYHFDDIKFLGQVEPYSIVQLTCHSCTMPVMATFAGGKSIGGKTKTDLKQAEEKRFVARGAISAGEIADFHRHLTTRTGWRDLIS